MEGPGKTGKGIIVTSEQMSDVNSHDANNNGTVDYIFVLRFVIKHRSMSFSFITEQLGMQPTHGFNVGEPRRTPKGNLLGGANNETFWGYNKKVYRHRDFFGYAVKFVESLQERHAFITDIRSSGGTVAVYIDLTGAKNIGSFLTTEQLAYIASVGIDVGVEYFPA